MKKLIVGLVCITSIGAIFAQGVTTDGAEMSPESVAPQVNRQGAKKIIEEYLISRFGKRNGVMQNKNGQFIATIGIGTIQAPKDDKNYNQARVNAFDKAMLDAKAKMAKFLEQEISVAVESAYAEIPEQLDGPEQEMAKAIATMDDDSIVGKAKKLISKKLDNALRKEGYDPDEVKAGNEAKTKEIKRKIDNILSKDEFKKVISSGAKSVISGGQALYTVEVAVGKRSEIGVAFVWSPMLARMANSLVTGRPVEGAKAKKPIIQQITKNADVLISTFGVQQKVNERGEYVLVSYGQSTAISSSSRAQQAASDKAKMNAEAMIRQFAGEYVSVNETQENAELTLEYRDDLLPDYNSLNSYKATQATMAKKMVINGIDEIYSWDAIHPISGQTVYGVVCTWSPKQAQEAREYKKKIEETAKDGAEGRRTVSPTTFRDSDLKQVPRVKDRVGIGDSADEDAF